MWRTLRPSAGQAQEWVSEWVAGSENIGQAVQATRGPKIVTTVSCIKKPPVYITNILGAGHKPRLIGKVYNLRVAVYQLTFSVPLL